jgi:NADPH-dependent curcumin reductase CurA
MAPYNIVSSTVYDKKKQKDQLQLLMAPSGSVKGLLKQQILKQPKLAQLNKMCKWLTAMHSEGNPVTGPTMDNWKS